MKKTKYRNNQNNYNNQIYSINYKFDSISPAGKCSGTALDLIKRYNELTKEAHGNGNYVEAEVFRQYAEHYRKIVTEINERKNTRFPLKEQENEDQTLQSSQNKAEETPVAENEVPVNNQVVAEEKTETTLVETKPTRIAKKAFTVIEVTDEKATSKKNCNRRKKNAEETAVNA